MKSFFQLVIFESAMIEVGSIKLAFVRKKLLLFLRFKIDQFYICASEKISRENLLS